MIASSLIRGTLVGLTALGLTAGTVAFAQSAGGPAKSADFSVKATPRGPITEGDGVTVVLVAKNDGSLEIGGAMFRARLPDGFTYVKGSTQGATHMDPHLDAKGQLMWDARDTKPGEATRLTFRMKAGPDSQGSNRCVQGFYWFSFRRWLFILQTIYSMRRSVKSERTSFLRLGILKTVDTLRRSVETIWTSWQRFLIF